MAPKCSYFSLIFDEKNWGNLMIHFETKTKTEHPIAIKARKKAQKIFSRNYCQWKQQIKTSIFVASKPKSHSITYSWLGWPSAAVAVDGGESLSNLGNEDKRKRRKGCKMHSLSWVVYKFKWKPEWCRVEPSFITVNKKYK